MKIHNKVSKIIGASVIILLVISSITTLAMGTFDEINASNKLPYSENIDGAPYRGHLRIYVVEIYLDGMTILENHIILDSWILHMMIRWKLIILIPTQIQLHGAVIWREIT